MKSLWRKLIDSVKESQFFTETGKARTDPNSKYACRFTAAWSYFRQHHGLRMSWDAFKAAAVKAKAIRDDFYFLVNGHNIIARVAGTNVKAFEEAGDGIAARALQLVTLGKTCLFSLNGEHYESIVGAEKYEAADGTERLRFLVEDPGGQGDTFADYDDLIVYHEDKNGDRVYSKNKKGGKRRITRLYWWM